MTIEQSTVSLRSAALALFFALVLSVGYPTDSYAACTDDAVASQSALNFLSNPSSLLNGPGGPRTPGEISSSVRDVVAANPQALAAVIAVLRDLGSSADQQIVDQRKAIGTGLGLAANTCIRPDPTFAAEIQTQLAGTSAADAKTAYAAVTGNQLIGSVGGGAGGGSAGSVGGQTSPFGTLSTTPSFQAFTSNSVSNTPTSFFSGGTSGAGSSSTTTNNPTPTNISNVTCTVSQTC